MHPALEKNTYVVKEHVGLFKAANNFDIFDADTGQELLHCREPDLGPIAKLLRFTDWKRTTPFKVEVTTPAGEPVLIVERGVSFFLSRVTVRDEQGAVVGGFQQKLFSIGGRFEVLDAVDRPVCQLQGKWTGWSFEFLSADPALGQRRLGRVSKKWSGMGKELLTSADNYVLAIEPSVERQDPVRLLILAAVLCIDMVLKE